LAECVLNYPAYNFRVLICEFVLAAPLIAKCNDANKKNQSDIMTRNGGDVGRICHWVEYNKRDYNKAGGLIVFPIVFTCWGIPPELPLSSCIRRPGRVNNLTFDDVVSVLV